MSIFSCSLLNVLLKQRVLWYSNQLIVVYMPFVWLVWSIQSGVLLLRHPAHDIKSIPPITLPISCCNSCLLIVFAPMCCCASPLCLSSAKPGIFVLFIKNDVLWSRTLDLTQIGQFFILQYNDVIFRTTLPNQFVCFQCVFRTILSEQFYRIGLQKIIPEQFYWTKN